MKQREKRDFAAKPHILLHLIFPNDTWRTIRPPLHISMWTFRGRYTGQKAPRQARWFLQASDACCVYAALGQVTTGCSIKRVSLAFQNHNSRMTGTVSTLPQFQRWSPSWVSMFKKLCLCQWETSNNYAPSLLLSRPLRVCPATGWLGPSEKSSNIDCWAIIMTRLSTILCYLLLLLALPVE